jgi:transcriptional regulator with XRE-family HTH domain
MAMHPEFFAENVRRASGAHLVPLERLAEFVGMSRPGLMKLVAHRGASRSRPSADTAVRLAGAFGVDVRDLYSEPAECLRAVAEAFEAAPIREAADAPETTLVTPLRVTVKREAKDARTIHLPRQRTKAKRGSRS